MCTKTHILYFLAGAAAFHAFAHFLLPFVVTLPILAWGTIEVTARMSIVAGVVSALVALGLLYWARKTEGEVVCKRQ